MADHSPELPSPDDLEARLRTAREREEGVSGRSAPPGGGRTGPGPGLGLAMRITVELVAGVAVGGAIGFGLDRWWGTRPWLMVAFLFLGFAGGLMNAYRAVKGMDDSVGFGAAQRRLQAKSDDED